MQIPKKPPIFRNFSANHWNQPETQTFQSLLFLFGASPKKPSSFSSNAENHIFIYQTIHFGFIKKHLEQRIYISYFLLF